MESAQHLFDTLPCGQCGLYKSVGEFPTVVKLQVEEAGNICSNCFRLKQEDRRQARHNKASEEFRRNAQEALGDRPDH